MRLLLSRVLETRGYEKILELVNRKVPLSPLGMSPLSSATVQWDEAGGLQRAESRKQMGLVELVIISG